jgi:hypothetical protein
MSLDTSYPKAIPCPHCGADLKAELPSLWASYRGSKPRPKAQGKKRPGIGGRPPKRAD